jgi:hypothetical protein
VGQKSGCILQALFTKANLEFQNNHFDPPPNYLCGSLYPAEEIPNNE